MGSVNFLLTLASSFRLILDCPMWNCSWNNLSKRAQVYMDPGGNVVNHVKAFLVRELRKYLILRFSLFAMSPTSVRYLAMCSTVDSLVSPANFVNLGILYPLGKSVCITKSAIGEA